MNKEEHFEISLVNIDNGRDIAIYHVKNNISSTPVVQFCPDM